MASVWSLLTFLAIVAATTKWPATSSLMRARPDHCSRDWLQFHSNRKHAEDVFRPRQPNQGDADALHAIDKADAFDFGMNKHSQQSRESTYGSHLVLVPHRGANTILFLFQSWFALREQLQRALPGIVAICQWTSRDRHGNRDAQEEKFACSADHVRFAGVALERSEVLDSRAKRGRK